jgi:hypothetical protein
LKGIKELGNEAKDSTPSVTEIMKAGGIPPDPIGLTGAELSKERG